MRKMFTNYKCTIETTLPYAKVDIKFVTKTDTSFTFTGNNFLWLLLYVKVLMTNHYCFTCRILTDFS